MEEVLYYPCTADAHGRICVKRSRFPMSKAKAEDFLKANFYYAWKQCEAIPQPATMQGLK